jgi:isocitrate dehydrogenase kinase/phosphatase
MTDTKTVAQLRKELEAAEWNELLAAKKSRQVERIEKYSAKVKEDQRVLDDAKKLLAEIDAQIKSGVIGIVPKPNGGGVVVNVPAGKLGVKGN